MRDGQQPELRPSVLCSPRSPRECTGKCRQFNGFGLVQTGSGPGGRWFKSTRPDHLFYNQQFTGNAIVVECLVHRQEANGQPSWIGEKQRINVPAYMDSRTGISDTADLCSCLLRRTRSVPAHVPRSCVRRASDTGQKTRSSL